MKKEHRAISFGEIRSEYHAAREDLRQLMEEHVHKKRMRPADAAYRLERFDAIGRLLDWYAENIDEMNMIRRRQMEIAQP